MTRLKAVRRILWGLVAAALVLLAFLLLRPAGPPPAPAPVADRGFGGPFTLVDSTGQPFSSTRLAGKPHALFFGFTHCPDVCPTTLARLVRLRRQIDPEAFQILFVSVDPDRDTPAEMARYVGLFDDPVIGLTGSPDQVGEVARQFGIAARKVPGHHGGDDYGVEHTATVLLFDRAGKLAGTIAPDEGDRAALAKLRRIAA